MKFENIQTEISGFGTVTVEAEASLKGTVTVFDKPGFVDGYVTAEIYGGKRKSGEAIIVFPAHGSLAFQMVEKSRRSSLGPWTKIVGIRTQPNKSVRRRVSA